MSTSSLVVDPGTGRKSLNCKKIVINKKKEPRKEMKAPNILNKIFHNSRVPNCTYYMTHSKSVDPKTARDVLTESTPYKYPRELEQFSFKVVQKMWAKKLGRKEISLKYNEKTNARTRQMEDLLSRLYVKDPPTVGMKTIFDIDPDFYTIAEGRPLDKRFSMANYLTDIREVLRTKLMTGFRDDKMLMIDEKLAEEQRVIDRIKDDCKLYSDSFETFLNKDYDEAMKEVRLAEKESIKTLEKCEEIKVLYEKLGSLQFSVHKLEEKFSDMMRYQKFLFYVSPMSWRRDNDYINQLKGTAERSASSKKHRRALDLPSSISFDNEDHITELPEPLLWFTDPEELKEVFKFIETQNLNCLLHTEELAIPLENMNESMKQAKKKFEAETSALQANVDSLKESILWEEQRAEFLKKKAMRLVDGEYKNVIAADEILKLQVLIEDLYESCIATNDSNFSVFEMMQAIEQRYYELVLELDSMPQHLVKKAEKHRFAERTKFAKLCKEAAAKITLVDRITWRLKKSLEPPVYRTTKPIMFRSPKPVKIPKPPKPPRKPTQTEHEYLSLFTDYCPYSDSLEDYGIDLSVPETDLRQVSAIKAIEPKER